MTTPEVIGLNDTGTYFLCPSCDAVSEEYVTIYECQQCGDSFTPENSADGDGNRCPSCNKFASKLTDRGCVECEREETEEIDGGACSGCGVLILATDLRQHVRREHPGAVVKE